MENIAYYMENISIVTYLVVFAGGVIASFTPCVYPLIPIMVGVIGTNKEQSRLKNFVLSLNYVIGMAITFSTLGVVAAVTGKLFGQIQSNYAAHLIVGNVIIVFALMLLDVIPMPVFFLSKAGAGKVIKGGNIFSALFMGAISGFVAAPCTAAVLAALLTYVATTQNVVFGFSLLFVFAIGLGTLLMLIGTFAGILKAMPKTEKFMEVMQKVLAFGMILLGEYYIFKAGMLNF
ncbi:MAG: sulfite exporter TauE/SafE family protein [Candidatus Omnitrophica bacterium]|nr:sulfite exporter TauE/SafE family protein [Candidatus Omnitrophota bacterium]